MFPVHSTMLQNGQTPPRFHSRNAAPPGAPFLRRHREPGEVNVRYAGNYITWPTKLQMAVRIELMEAAREIDRIRRLSHIDRSTQVAEEQLRELRLDSDVNVIPPDTDPEPEPIPEPKIPINETEPIPVPEPEKPEKPESTSSNPPILEPNPYGERRISEADISSINSMITGWASIDDDSQFQHMHTYGATPAPVAAEPEGCMRMWEVLAALVGAVLAFTVYAYAITLYIGD